MTTLLFRQGIGVLTGADSVVDRVARRIRFFQGEWIFNPLLGIAYNEVFESRGVILDDLKRKVLEVEGVTGAELSIRGFDSNSRTLTIDMDLSTEFGRRFTQIEI